MYDFLINTPPIVAITVFFLLSLIGAIVLFHFLKSTGVFSTVKGQAGGALAGFLMIFAAMQGSYLALAPGAEEIAGLKARIAELQQVADVEEWTLRGNVVRPEDVGPAAVIVRVLPHSPQFRVDRFETGFRLTDVKIRNGTWPELYIEGDAYHSIPKLLTDDDLEIHPERKLAIVKDPLVLRPNPHASFEIAETNN